MGDLPRLSTISVRLQTLKPLELSEGEYSLDLKHLHESHVVVSSFFVAASAQPVQLKSETPTSFKVGPEDSFDILLYRDSDRPLAVGRVSAFADFERVQRSPTLPQTFLPVPLE